MHMHVQYVCIIWWIKYAYLLSCMFMHLSKMYLSLTCICEERVCGKKENEFIMEWNDSCSTNQIPFTTDRIITACASHKTRDSPSTPSCKCMHTHNVGQILHTNRFIWHFANIRAMHNNIIYSKELHGNTFWCRVYYKQ